MTRQVKLWFDGGVAVRRKIRQLADSGPQATVGFILGKNFKF